MRRSRYRGRSATRQQVTKCRGGGGGGGACGGAHGGEGDVDGWMGGGGGGEVMFAVGKKRGRVRGRLMEVVVRRKAERWGDGGGGDREAGMGRRGWKRGLGGRVEEFRNSGNWGALYRYDMIKMG